MHYGKTITLKAFSTLDKCKTRFYRQYVNGSMLIVSLFKIQISNCFGVDAMTWLNYLADERKAKRPVQFSLFMHPDQAQNTLSGIQGQEVTAVAVIYVTAPTYVTDIYVTDQALFYFPQLGAQTFRT